VQVFKGRSKEEPGFLESGDSALKQDASNWLGNS